MPTSTVKQDPARLTLRFLEQRFGRRLHGVTCILLSLRNKTHAPASCLTLVFVGIFLGLANHQVQAQTLRAQIKIVSVAPAKVLIELELPAPTDVLSFRNTYAGVLGLADRIEGVEANSGGRNIPIKKLAPGEYQAEEPFTRLRYEVNIAEPAQPAQKSHLSWLTQDHGLLMLADLLPRGPSHSGSASTVVAVEVPIGWTIASNIAGADAQYSTAEPDKAVFVVGPSVRKNAQRLGSTDLSVVTSGKWPTSGKDVLKIVEKLIKEYSIITGHVLRINPVLILFPFDGDAGPERWTAETRGNATVLLLGNQASRKKVLAKLGIVLSHEIFHLWVPNAMALEGDYDWFFEGFTLYQALRTALRFKWIEFDSYLETIARVYDSYLSSVDRYRLSLIEASERRWTTASSLVYDKGMLVAFIYDLAMRSATDCQVSLDDVYRQLFQLRGTGQGSANETIIKILRGPANMESFSREYVEGKGRIDLQWALASYGIELRSTGLPGQATRLTLANDLNKQQRKALRCIGYRS